LRRLRQGNETKMMKGGDNALSLKGYKLALEYMGLSGDVTEEELKERYSIERNKTSPRKSIEKNKKK